MVLFDVDNPVEIWEDDRLKYFSWITIQDQQKIECDIIYANISNQFDGIFPKTFIQSKQSLRWECQIQTKLKLQCRSFFENPSMTKMFYLQQPSHPMISDVLKELGLSTDIIHLITNYNIHYAPVISPESNERRPFCTVGHYFPCANSVPI